MTPTPSVRLSISVVIPVKDDAALLAACLGALSQQGAPLLEIIVVDNGSTDDSADVARKAGATLLYESRRGIAAASETGYDFARGDIIARIDADTLVPPDWSLRILEEFTARPDVGVVTGGASFTDGPASLRKPAELFYLGAYFVLAGLALTHAPLFGSNFAMRRSAWNSVRATIHDSDRIHDDFDLSFHLGRHHRIRYLAGLRVGISMRPLFAGGRVLRLRRGFHTVALHWPEELPWRRFGRRLSARALGFRRVPSATAGRTARITADDERSAYRR